tara:strand:- start:210 stop:398 length:189 start_codon:yes stop_codon:yes gene_type:complete
MKTQCNCGFSKDSQPKPFEGSKLADIKNAFQPLRVQKKGKINYLMVFLVALLVYVIVKRISC